MTMEAANQIITISQPMTVSMADAWYQYGTDDHFWVKHRNAIFDRHFGSLIQSSNLVGEVGCGSGVILKHLAKRYRKAADGFELNLAALNLCPPLPGQLYVYDILSRHSKFVNSYDVLLLMDVLEHIEAEVEFLEAIRDHLKPGGFAVVGVPMRQHLYSAYDKADGHFRRYSTRYLRSVLQAAGFQVKKTVEWGHIYIPILMLRKIMLQGKTGSEAIQQGFSISKPANTMLSLLRHLDFIPTAGITGASSMVLVQK